MAADHTRLLLFAPLGDMVIAFALAVIASQLLRRFIRRLLERHRDVALHLMEPEEGRVQRLHAYLRARESRRLNDPTAHAFAFGAYICAWMALILIALAALSLLAAPFF